jgi:hypothetical protein
MKKCFWNAKVLHIDAGVAPAPDLTPAGDPGDVAAD